MTEARIRRIPLVEEVCTPDAVDSLATSTPGSIFWHVSGAAEGWTVAFTARQASSKTPTPGTLNSPTPRRVSSAIPGRRDGPATIQESVNEEIMYLVSLAIDDFIDQDPKLLGQPGRAASAAAASIGLYHTPHPGWCLYEIFTGITGWSDMVAKILDEKRDSGSG